MTSKTILIADDDSDLVDALAMRCRQLGLSVFVAYDGLTALTLLNQQSPDLVCLDVNMPGGSGMAVCEMLASDPNHAEIPVIIYTGRSDDQTKTRCKQLGAHYVLKTRDAWPRLTHLVCTLLDIKPERTVVSDAAVNTWPA